MPHLLLVMFGGAIGAGCRYGVARATAAQLGTGFPWGTLVVNILGGLLAGGLTGLLLSVEGKAEPLRLFLGMGVLGGFTTFSAFSAETADMLQGGEVGLAAAYILSSVVGAIGLFFLGLWLARGLA